MESQASESSGDWVHLGEAIRHGRRRTGMTQGELADAAGVDRKTIGNYERGRVPVTAPRIPDGYYQVAEALGWKPVDVQRLLRTGPRPDLARRIREVNKQLMELSALRVFEEDTAGEATAETMASLDRVAARRHLLEWERGTQIDADGTAVADDPRGPVRAAAAPSPSTSDNPLALFPWVTRFGQACVRHGADPDLRDRLLFAAHELLEQANAAASRDAFGLAAYRPHGWAEGDPAVPEDDAARIRKAVEEHKRNR